MDNKHMRQLTFETASEAFDFYYGTIPYEGVDFAGTKAMFNQGFLIKIDRCLIMMMKVARMKFSNA